MNVNNSNGTILNFGNGSIDVGNIVLNTACNITDSGNTLTKPLRQNDLESIGIENSPSLPVTLTQADAQCFKAAVDVDTNVKEIIGDIIELNKNAKSGIIHYIDDGKIYSRKFSLASESIVTSAIDSMKENRCRLYCHEEYISSPDGTRNIVSLQAIKIESV